MASRNQAPIDRATLCARSRPGLKLSQQHGGRVVAQILQEQSKGLAFLRNILEVRPSFHCLSLAFHCPLHCFSAAFHRLFTVSHRPSTPSSLPPLTLSASPSLLFLPSISSTPTVSYLFPLPCPVSFAPVLPPAALFPAPSPRPCRWLARSCPMPRRLASTPLCRLHRRSLLTACCYRADGRTAHGGDHGASASGSEFRA